MCEIRFSEYRQELCTLLPGRIHDAVGGAKYKLERTPVSSIPQQVRQDDIELWYLPIVRLEAANSLVLVGEQSVAVVSKSPYPGWAEFSVLAADVFSKAAEVQNGKIARASVRYINFLEAPIGPDQVRATTLSVAIKGYELSEEPLQLRMQLLEGELTAIVQITTQAQIAGGGDRTGVVIDVDVVCAGTFEGVDNAMYIIERAHNFGKRVFFSLLADDTIAALGPTYEGTPNA